MEAKKQSKTYPTHRHSEYTEPFIDEEQEWLHLSPAQRLRETGKLWGVYLTMGGSLDPEPNSQSPFYFP